MPPIPTVAFTAQWSRSRKAVEPAIADTGLDERPKGHGTGRGGDVVLVVNIVCLFNSTYIGRAVSELAYPRPAAGR